MGINFAPRIQLYMNGYGLHEAIVWRLTNKESRAMWCIYNQYDLSDEKFENTNGVIRRTYMMYNTMTKRKEKRQRKNNHLQNTTQKTKNRVTRTALKSMCELGY